VAGISEEVEGTLRADSNRMLDNTLDLNQKISAVASQRVLPVS
jgi:hypothetical protein